MVYSFNSYHKRTNSLSNTKRDDNFSNSFNWFREIDFSNIKSRFKSSYFPK